MKEALYYERKVKLYEYEELSETAKEKVKEWFVDDDFRANKLTYLFKELWIDYYFPNSKLDIQWSLSYCQGDGVNVSGKFNFNDLFFYAKSNCEYDFKKANFTGKEMKRLQHYMEQTEIKVGENRRYGYCVVQSKDYFVTDWLWNLSGYRDIDEELLERLSELFYHAINNLCKDMEHYGYKILYEPDDEEIIETANVNEWYFDEYGNVVYDYDELIDCDIA